MRLVHRVPRWLVPWRWPASTVHALLFMLLLAWAAMQCFGPLRSEGIGASTYDQMQQWRLWSSPPDERLLIIDIDERSLAEMAGEFGRWPWPRDTLATVLAHAEQQGAAALVFDILFSDPDRLHPGGDHALSAAVQTSRIGLYPVARLPARLDGQSDLAIDQLPGLAAGPADGHAAPKVALIVPFMRSMLDSGRTGTHTAQRDADGKIRRFAFTERFDEDWTLRSIPAAVAVLSGVPVEADGVARPIVWRERVDAYPRVPFSVAWACAEGRPRADCPSLRGRILVLGATASSLHDLQASPLSNQHAGVDILATLIDNALHRRAYRELPAAWRFVLSAAALTLALSLVWRGSAGATKRALVFLPTLLLGLGFASLHTEVVYLDLMLPAALTLSFLSAVAAFDALRCRWWGHAPGSAKGPHGLACGAPAAAAERIERAVFDFAAHQCLQVSGGRAASGDCGSSHVLWALWGLADVASAQRAVETISNAVPAGWARCFAIGPEPQRDFFLAVAAASAGTARQRTHPSEHLHAI